MSVAPIFEITGLSLAELTAAVLDGDLSPVGEAFVPADALETPWLRAQSLRTVIGTSLAATHALAAWVWGASAEPPGVLTVQRVSATRKTVSPNPRIAYRDGRLEAEDTISFGSVNVTSVPRTMADLARSRDYATVELLIAQHAQALPAAVVWCERHTRRPGARDAIDYLSRRVATMTE